MSSREEKIASYKALIDLHNGNIRFELHFHLRSEAERKRLIGRERCEIKELEALIKQLEAAEENDP